MNTVLLFIIGLLVVIVFALIAFIGWLFLKDYRDTKARVDALEKDAKPNGSRLSHADILNAENASAALSKIRRELQTYIDYLDNANFWVGKIRNQVEEDED